MSSREPRSREPSSREPTSREPQLYLVLSTVATREQAAELAERLVTEHRAACVTALPGARSVYTWQGRVQQDEEVVLLIKTAWRDDAERARFFAYVKELHPYDEPELVALAPDAVQDGYLAWALAAVRAPGSST